MKNLQKTIYNIVPENVLLVEKLKTTVQDEGYDGDCYLQS